MIIVPVKDGENIERALKKFKRKFERTGIVKELRARQQFTKPGSTETYASVAEYLAQDKTYQSLPESSRKAYVDTITDQFNQFMADDAILKKFTRADGTRYVSAREYLENDAAYQQLVKNTQEKTNPYVREVNKKYTALCHGF